MLNCILMKLKKGRSVVLCFGKTGQKVAWRLVDHGRGDLWGILIFSGLFAMRMERKWVTLNSMTVCLSVRQIWQRCRIR